MTSVSPNRYAYRRQTAALATAVLAGSLVTACTSEDEPTPKATNLPTSLAACRSYGLPTAPVTLKLPGLVLREALPLPARNGTGPRLALMAVDEQGPDKSADASASLFDGPASTAPDRIRSGIWVANIEDSRRRGASLVAEKAISVSAATDTAQATNVSHSTFTTGPATNPIWFDYWAFTANGHRYLLGYVRKTPAKSPDAATFFAIATSCAKSTS